MVKFTSIKFIFLMLIVQSSAYASHENHQSTPEQQNEDKGTNDQTYNLDFQYHVLQSMLDETGYAKTIVENPNIVLVHPKEIAKQRHAEKTRLDGIALAMAIPLIIILVLTEDNNPFLLSRLRFQLLKDVRIVLFGLLAGVSLASFIKDIIFGGFESRARATTNLTLIVDNLIHLKRFIPKRYHMFFQQLDHFRACSDRHEKLFQQQAPKIVAFLLSDIQSVLQGKRTPEQEEYFIENQLNKVISNSDVAKNHNFSEIFSTLQTIAS